MTPVLLTNTEALGWAANRLEEMAKDMELASMLLDSFKRVGGEAKLDGKALADIAKVRRSLPEPKLQMRALKDAAEAIRELALEDRLVAARMGGDG